MPAGLVERLQAGSAAGRPSVLMSGAVPPERRARCASCRSSAAPPAPAPDAPGRSPSQGAMLGSPRGRRRASSRDRLCASSCLRLLRPLARGAHPLRVVNDGYRDHSCSHSARRRPAAGWRRSCGDARSAERRSQRQRRQHGVHQQAASMAARGRKEDARNAGSPYVPSRRAARPCRSYLLAAAAALLQAPQARQGSPPPTPGIRAQGI